MEDEKTAPRKTVFIAKLRLRSRRTLAVTFGSALATPKAQDTIAEIVNIAGAHDDGLALPARTDDERAAISAATRARVERTLAEREAKRLAARPWLCALDGVLQSRNPPAPE